MNGLVIPLGDQVRLHMTHGMVEGARGGRTLNRSWLRHCRIDGDWDEGTCERCWRPAEVEEDNKVIKVLQWLRGLTSTLDYQGTILCSFICRSHVSFGIHFHIPCPHDYTFLCLSLYMS